MDQLLKGKVTLVFIILLFALGTRAQKLPLFDSKEMLAMVDRGGDYIYSEKFDSAEWVIKSIEKKLPNHPIVSMMRAMNLAWQDQPMRTTRPIFVKHLAELNKTLIAAEKLRENDPENLEALFFEMSVHGLMAEYYAREGSYLMAVSQAQQTYSLLKVTMEQTNRSPEFYFLAGLYNYFREKYPERHPMYKPFLWLYRSGDIARGLVQLDSAVNHSKIVKVEAAIYLSYIYLRYENKPEMALKYLKNLHLQYPANSYFKTKYIECLVLEHQFEEALPLIQDLIDSSKPYNQLCGFTYQALYFEKVLNSPKQAEKYYDKALKVGKQCPDRGEYYRSLACLGLGRILVGRGEFALAENYFNMAIQIDESPAVTLEAEQRLGNLKNR